MGLCTYLSNYHTSFSEHLLSAVDVNLEVIRDLNHVCDSEITDLESSKTYFFQLNQRVDILNSRVNENGGGGYFR